MLEAKFEASACTYEFHEQDLLQEKSAQKLTIALDEIFRDFG